VWEGKTLTAHQWLPWESYLDLVVGLVVCAETTSTLWLTGAREFIGDCWGVFDASVVILTLLSWFLIFLQRTALPGRGILALDLPLLALRFVLQPCRLLATASIAQRVRTMQKNTIDIAFDVLENSVEMVPPTPSGGLLSKWLEAEIRQQLPTWCRYREWSLAYSPRTHGTSMGTFYRLQSKIATCGANIIVLKDGMGGILGGFSTEPWQICGSRGYYGSGDCFVFAMRSGEELEFYHHVPYKSEDVLLWADCSGFSLSGAVVVHSDFQKGSSQPSSTFGSPGLSTEGADFTILAFECWLLGGVGP